MAVVKDGQAPYAPTPAVMAVLEGFRTKHPKTPFDLENIQLLGVSQSLAPRTLQSLNQLGLIDDSGEPTAAMVALREANGREYADRLADVVRDTYAEVFAYRDPTTQTPEQLREIFRFYRPPSQHDRMLRLFYGLCAAAGLIQEAPVIEKSNGDRESRPRKPVHKADRAKTNGEGAKPDVQTPPPPTTPSVQLPEIVAALVAKLPKKGEPWTADEAEWWLDMAGMAFPREYGYEPKEKR